MLIGRPSAQTEAAPRASATKLERAGPSPEQLGADSLSGLGRLPVLTLTASVGVFLVSGAHRLSQSGVDGQAIFWSGVVLIIAPILARQLSGSPTRAERVGLVLLLGLALYLVKVAANPQAFTYSDELTQVYNVDTILETGRLFYPNPLVVVTHLYPGLQSLGAAVTTLTGLSVFQAGIAVAALARLMMMLMVFLLLEQVSHSPRVGGLGATLYAGHPNFLFYSAEFSYESLALPLAGVVLLAALRRAGEASSLNRLGWTLTALVAIVTVTVTHHLTSYALAATLCAATLAGDLLKRRMLSGTIPRTWDLALASVISVALWFVTIASPTNAYLSVVLGPAAQQGLALLFGQAGRRLFQPGFGINTPLWQQLTAFSSVVLVALGLAYGLWRLPRRVLWSPVGFLLVLAAALYIPVQTLRLTQAGWETANRSSEFLFLGCALVLAIAMRELFARARSKVSQRAALLTAGGLVIVVGGAMTGWPYQLQLPPPYLVMADNGRIVEPEDVTLARWTREHLGRNNVMFTDPSNTLMMGAYGQQIPYTGTAGGVQAMLLAPYVDETSVAVVQRLGARYVVLDRRARSWDHSLGFYPPGGAGPLSTPSPDLDPAIVGKLEGLDGVNRIADSGNVVVYDVRGLDSASLR
jgi:hypothetical protein